MKINLITLSLLLCTFVANSQSLPRYSSANCGVGKMLNGPQTSIKQRLVKIEKIRSLLFEAVTVTNTGTDISESGLRISGTTGRNYAPTMAAYIDTDELEELISAVDNMMANTVDKPAPQTTVEYKYQSRSGFAIRVYNVKPLLSGAKKWHLSIKLVDGMPLSEYLFPVKDLAEIKNAAVLVKASLGYRVLNATK